MKDNYKIINVVLRIINYTKVVLLFTFNCYFDLMASWRERDVIDEYRILSHGANLHSCGNLRHGSVSVILFHSEEAGLIVLQTKLPLNYHKLEN